MPHSLSAGPGQEDPAVPSSPPPAPAAADAAETKASLAALFDGSDDEGDDDGISDGDFGSSQDLLREAETSAAAAVAAAAAAAATARYTDPELLRAFYQRLFPFRTLFHWLNHGPKPGPDFANREFAFTLQNGSYLRYQSFTTGDLLRKQCAELVPSRFEIGPIYSTNPRERKTLRKASAFRPIGKELVFDIDMTDYDEIRTCCAGASVCRRCWTFIAMAVRVLDTALRDDFGFRHVLWVYSGRRGAHAWVCDRRARQMGDVQRRAVAGYLELLKGGGGERGGKRVNIRRPLHPHVDLNILKGHFEQDILKDQDPWATDEHAGRLLDLLPDKKLTTALRRKWDSAPGRSSSSKWADIDVLASTTLQDSGDASTSTSTSASRALLDAKIDIVLEYTYPRLDAEVSKKLNHLLKSPFCVHPATGRVCVPIDPLHVHAFDPAAVPIVTALLAEIDAWHAAHADPDPDADMDDGAADAPAPATGQKQRHALADYEKTSLKPHVDFFRAFVANLLNAESATDSEQDGATEAMQLDF